VTLYIVLRGSLIPAHTASIQTYYRRQAWFSSWSASVTRDQKSRASNIGLAVEYSLFWFSRIFFSLLSGKDAVGLHLFRRQVEDILK